MRLEVPSSVTSSKLNIWNGTFDTTGTYSVFVKLDITRQKGLQSNSGPMCLHALWYIRVSDVIPVLKHKGILSIFEYSRPLHPPLTPFIQYWGTLMRDRFPVLNTLPKLKYFPRKKPYNGNFSTKLLFWKDMGRNGPKFQN